KNDSVSFRWITLLLALVRIEAQKKSSINNSAILLTPSLASQCGFNVKTDQWGNTIIFASLQNCFAQNADDKIFTTMLSLRVHGNQVGEDEVHQVVETCQYPAWASREIICEHNYMEVSVKRAAPGDYAPPGNAVPGTNPKFSAPQTIDGGFRITRLKFFSPVEKTMSVTEAQRSGYGIVNSPSRLVLRSPKTSLETYTQMVAGVPMMVLKTSAIFEKKWLATQIEAAVACSVSFTPDTITWYLPCQVDPLISSGQFKLLEVHMGVDGQRLDAAEMAARQYTLFLNDLHVVVQIPVGAAGGHFKSHVQDNQYFTSYMVTPMVELLWTEDDTHEETRYKVLFPIATPFLSRPPQVIDNTVPEQWLFKVLVGPFGSDVALMNITFPSEILSVTDCVARGFSILEHISPNSSSKVFTLEVPFTDPVVQQMREMSTMVYSLHPTFGLLVLPEFTPFSVTAYLEARLVETVPPSISGGCDYKNFYVLVKYGTQGFNFQTMLGKQILTSGLAQQYNLIENGTHLSMAIPFSAPAVAVESSSIRGRLDVVLQNLETKQHMKAFTLACNFPSTLTECFPNGTITSVAVKVESVPSLDPSKLTLRDPSCGPVYSNEHYAYFVFTANSCGTTRKFFPNAMMYVNEISLPDELQKTDPNSEEAEYELKISCYYDINMTHAVAFHPRPRRSEPYAENAKGAKQVAIRLALDDSFSVFHKVEDYPTAKYLQQPLYFEVELMQSNNPKVSLELENCWATQKEDRTSEPRWNFIIDGCASPADPYQVLFHPVWVDSRVQYPSHFKRFEVQMFAFAEDQENLGHQLFVHCDVVICDARNPLGGVCNGQCPNQENRPKGQRRAIQDGLTFKYVALGPILVI
uniref:Uncharacterized LOC115038229 n=1 Tax=Echeneis naucrates TaxID=173247 RepID=A0A665WE19_ECHNA